MEQAMAARRKPARRAARSALRKTGAKSGRKTAAKPSSSRRWSQRVTRESDALDLKKGVFQLTSAKKIAASLKRSAERSARRKTGAYRSALSMLTFLHQPRRKDAAADAAHAAGAGQRCS